MSNLTGKLLNKKPIIGYWKSGDPTKKMDLFKSKLETVDYCVVRTKVLTDEFIDHCILNKDKIYIHMVITGMAQTPFEYNIPTVKNTFFNIKKLIDKGFSQKQILIVVDPILQNYNGISVLKLILRVFTEFKELRMRYIRFKLIPIRNANEGVGKDKYEISNENISKRDLRSISPYLIKTDDFFRDYYKLLNDYRSIISVDTGDEALIGVRELMAFGLKNECTVLDKDGKPIKMKIIEYENGNKYKPMVKVISGRAVRCSNRCMLCPYFG